MIDMKNVLHWVKFAGLFLWQLPQNIVALLMMPFLGKLSKIDYRNYAWAFMGSKMLGGISLGCFVFLSPYESKRETAIAHELDGHTKDSKKWGPLYLFVIGIPSILNAWLKFTKCYYDFYPERWANKNAGLGVDSKCRLYFLDKPDYKKKSKKED